MGIFAPIAAAGAAAAEIGAAAAATSAAATAGSSLFSWGSLALGALGAASSTLGQIQQSRYQAAIAKNNAAISEMQAQDALRRGDIAEQTQRRRTALVLGTQRAALAGQGTALDSGSPLDVQMDTAGVGELDALTIRSNAAREAWAHRVQAGDFMAQSRLARPGLTGTSASLLGGATSVADRWWRYRRAGLV